MRNVWSRLPPIHQIILLRQFDTSFSVELWIMQEPLLDRDVGTFEDVKWFHQNLLVLLSRMFLFCYELTTLLSKGAMGCNLWNAAISNMTLSQVLFTLADGMQNIWWQHCNNTIRMQNHYMYLCMYTVFSLFLVYAKLLVCIQMMIW